LAERPTEVADLQALAMIGQVGLLTRWREALDSTTIGQVLVTRSDLEHDIQRESFVRSLQRVWDYSALPIVNENDAVSSEEITFGDNDQLAARIAVTLGAEKLLLLTDQDGIQEDFGTESQRRIETLSMNEIERHIAPVQSKFGKGGASSKILAAQYALQGGVEVYIAHALEVATVESVLSRKSGTKVVQ
jgi:glutamate 5-kinase